jgi:beta-glucuronidase
MTENKQQRPILIGGFLGTLRKRVNSPIRKLAFPGARGLPREKILRAEFSFSAGVTLWTPENQKLYTVEIATEADQVTDRIGFRSIEVRGTDILLNGKSMFLRGISMHEEAPTRAGRAWSEDDARTLLGWAKALGCNFVRLAHYPHNEATLRVADQMGLLVWAEVPVYWTIQWENPETLRNAKNQLSEMIARDQNRAALIIYSVGNETPISDARNRFLLQLIQHAHSTDPTRLVSAALQSTEVAEGNRTIECVDSRMHSREVICLAVLGHDLARAAFGLV